MAIVVLVLWLFTAGAGFYLLVTSNLARPRSPEPAPAPAPAAAPVRTSTPPSTPAPPVTPAPPATPAPAATSATPVTPAPAPSRREARRAARARFDTPSLIASRNAPIVPGSRSLLEFAHPLCALAGLACWLGFTLVHNRGLGWAAFGLVAVTACAGLAWFTANARAGGPPGPGSPRKPSFNPRLVVLHGTAATVTITLAALAMLAIVT